MPSACAFPALGRMFCSVLLASTGNLWVLNESAHGQPVTQLFSIDASSPSTASFSPADILVTNPVGGPPLVIFSSVVLGLQGGDDIDAIAVRMPQIYPPSFSVDRAAVSQPGASSFIEAAVGQAAGDIYVPTLLPGSNILAINQNALGLIPLVGAGVPVSPPIDNLDALELIVISQPLPAITNVFYSLTPGSPTLAALGATPADILVTGAGGAPSVAIPLGASPLLRAGDDVDALAFDSVTNNLAISLSPSSPTVSAGFVSAGDVLFCPVPDCQITGIPLLFPIVALPAESLGLLRTDNLDAIAYTPLHLVDGEPPPPCQAPSRSCFPFRPVPEPSTFVLLASGLVGWGAWKRKQLMQCSEDQSNPR